MADTVQLDVEVVLPEVPDTDDACLQRLSDALAALDGVEQAHLTAAEATRPPKLCIHYRRATLGLGDVRRLALEAGARLQDQYGHALWEVDGVGHERRARTVRERLESLDGVIEAEATSAGLVRVEYDRDRIGESELRAALADLGVRPRAEQTSANGDASATATRETGRAADGPGGDHRSNDGAGGRAGVEQAHDHADRSDEHEHEHEKAGHGHEHGGILGERAELGFAIGAGVAYLTGVLLGWLTDLPQIVSTACYWAAYALGGFFTVREAVDNIRARRFEVDFLMLVAAAGAAALGKWAEGAVLLFLFSLGHALEHYAMGRARRAIEALAELAPKTALVRRGDRQEEVPVEELELGDVVIAKPNERLPADGVVVEGESSVDQAPVTGESIPVDKRPVADREQALREPDAVDPEHRVFAGTINGSGVLGVAVTSRAADTTLARVVRLVQEAETQRSPTQRFTDRFERFFVPVVLALAGLMLLSWVVVDEPFSASFYRSMAVLVAASPCALAIATPSAVLSGVARAARGGVLVKGGGPLENLGRLTAIAFDKTGTLTEGKPRLTDVVPAEGVGELDLLTPAVAVERLSDHPLAAAIARDGATRVDGERIPDAEDLRSITGRGLQARVEADLVHVGSRALFSEVDGAPVPDGLVEAADRLEGEGRTTMIVRRGERYLGVIGLMDTPRPAAASVIGALRELGIRRTIMISGDNQRVAEAVAAEVGVDEAWGGLMPEDKVDAMRKLRESERRAAMVGDGVNDAPAMATATVGIAMGAAGSDVALETADVALMADDLDKLTFATGLSRATSRIIRQNLFASLGIVAVLIPATILGLGIGPAVAVHEGSTLLVVFNALRLLAFKWEA